jgi:hypothetical protein
MILSSQTGQIGGVAKDPCADVVCTLDAAFNLEGGIRDNRACSRACRRNRWLVHCLGGLELTSCAFISNAMGQTSFPLRFPLAAHFAGRRPWF